jgi:hypothetical protein
MEVAGIPRLTKIGLLWLGGVGGLSGWVVVSRCVNMQFREGPLILPALQQ